MDKSIQKSTIMMKRLRSKSESKKSGRQTAFHFASRKDLSNVDDLMMKPHGLFLESEYSSGTFEGHETQDQTPAHKRQQQSHWVSTSPSKNNYHFLIGLDLDLSYHLFSRLILIGNTER